MVLKFLIFVVCFNFFRSGHSTDVEVGAGGINFASIYGNSTQDLSSRNGRSSGGAIIFPNFSNGSEEVSDTTCRTCFSPKKIPFKLLREISVENDVSRIFEKYVSNVRIKDQNGIKVLTDLQGKPIDINIGDSVAVRLAPNSPSVSVFKSYTGTASTVKNTIGPSKPTGRPELSIFAVRRKPVITNSGNGTAERIGPGPAVSEIERITKHASCEPELRTARVPGSDDPKMFIYPKCVRIHQCGGCCGSSLLSCEPTQKKTVEVQVQKFIYNDFSGKLDYEDSDKISMEAHLECRCGCRVKSEDCSPLHVHDPDECQCVCRDQGRRSACQTNQLKQWNPFTCQCECRELRDCNSGFIFSAETCECVSEQRTLLNQNQNSRRRRDRLSYQEGRMKSR